MELPRSMEDDFLYWKYHPSGKFTVKTGYYFLTKRQRAEHLDLSLEEHSFVKLIWKLKILPKWKIFLWKLFHDRIVVKRNLAKRGIQVEETCVFCGEDEEDSQHLFRLCNLAKEVWENGSLAICSDSTGFDSLREWIQYYILLFYSEDGKYGTRSTKFIATLWGLWKMRNARSFNGANGGIDLALEFVNLAMREQETFCQNIRESMENRDNSREDSYPPPPGFNSVQLGKDRSGFDDFIVGVDGSWDKRTTRAGIGWVAMGGNNENEVSEGGKYGVATSALHCEAWACLEAMKWAKEKGRQGILILLDSIMLINNLHDQSGKDILISWIAKEIREVGALFQWCTILKVQRDQIQRADEIARKCRTSLSNYM
ncbi:uncharacterized protein LOC110723513 [Chenopodium quinoa]|uniref:uncharacterized protein LOC110723513 n=1 Tax=Chenopodium quinoa TaxID=63459 RepID=UPI000B779F64|nr:uncharacterized protein LOC110723513 [Chenopodium quinoa]